MDIEEATSTTADTAVKRKRSPSSAGQPSSAPVAKASKTGASNQLSINYLARQSQEDLPLIKHNDTLPNLLQLLAAYGQVLDRHESLASNLGARPLGPILIKRFERCFDAPPKVVASHHKGGSNPEDLTQPISWLEVIEFARSHPSQFTLSTFSEGKRVCQFYYPQKQIRVQISDEDFLFINSGRCQELIPPLPIWEDEEKEVVTCDVLEAKLKELTNAADMVAARTRQLSHRLKGRRAAILERREAGGSGTPAKASAPQTTTAPPSSGGSGFTAVNSSADRPNDDGSGHVNDARRHELLKHFEGLPQNQAHGRTLSRHSQLAGPEGSGQVIKTTELTRENGGADSTNSSLSPVPLNAFPHDTLSYYIATDPALATHNSAKSTHRLSLSGGSHAYATAHTPLKHNFSKPLPPAQEESQPFRPLCQAHMDGLPRGQRVLPPCDRCRRLQMDCIKNLTSCAGCTKKHARCHWVHVSRDEVGALDHLMEAAYPGVGSPPAMDGSIRVNGYTNGNGEMTLDEAVIDDDSDDDDSNPLEDLEALGEKEEREHEAAAERMREDEEGLRNARELARQGWEEGLRHDQPTDVTEEPQPEQAHHEDAPMGGGDEASPVVVPLVNGGVGNHVDDGNEDDKIEVKSFTGFRAVNTVNEPVENGSVGWRPS